MKLGYFVYNNKTYNAGTEFIYSGECEANGQKTFLSNQHCKFLYSQDKSYFQVGDTICSCHTFNFTQNLVSVIEYVQPQEKQKFYFTDDEIIKTVWYILLMLVATLFQDRVGLWILLTIIYITTTFCNRK